MRFLLSLGLTLLLVHAASANNLSSWWPEQQVPDTILVCRKCTGLPEENLAMSISGNVARALNEGIVDEGIWIDVGNPCYRSYLSSLVDRTGAVKDNRTYNVWELLSIYAGKGILKGYVLYDADNPQTVNIATTRAAVLDAVIVEKSIEDKVMQTGLPLLYDASNGISQRDNFMEIRHLLDNDHIVLASPGLPNNRDFAIAYKSMVYYGVDSLLNEILEWVEPLSPVIGWNEGPESGHIIPCTLYGLVNTVSDFCYNMPLLMSARDSGSLDRTFTTVDPRKIRWNSRKAGYHSFLMSDGDNMQWTLGNFMDNDEYWASKYSGMVSMSYTSCAANLSMSAEDPLDMLIRTQPDRSSVVEYGGGYYYPDLFAARRPDRAKLLGELARIVNVHMQRTGIKVFGFICMDLYSKEAMQAYEIFARELTGIVGMVAIQYSPYNGGHGDVFWVKDRNGDDIPVCTARYQVWANLHIPGSGTPQRIVECINADAEAGDDTAYGFTIVHAWSRFARNGDGSVRELDQKSREGQRGVEPVLWGADFIDRKTSLVTVEELLWRIRMDHDPQRTKEIISEMQ